MQNLVVRMHHFDFKQDVYRRALVELAQYLPKVQRSANESATHATVQ